MARAHLQASGGGGGGAALPEEGSDKAASDGASSAAGSVAGGGPSASGLSEGAPSPPPSEGAPSEAGDGAVYGTSPGSRTSSACSPAAGGVGGVGGVGSLNDDGGGRGGDSSGALDRVYVAGSGDLQTFACVELHVLGAAGAGEDHEAGGESGEGASPADDDAAVVARLSADAGASSPALPVADPDGSPRLYSTAGGAGWAGAAPPRGSLGGHGGESHGGDSTPGFGITVVEATCHRAANATWSDATPSPDLLLKCAPLAHPATSGVVCLGPGLVTVPVKSLVNGRMTLTQVITHHP